MKQWCEIRHKVLVEGVSKRSILREYGLHWRTLKKILALEKPPGYQTKGKRPKRKLDRFLDRIREILKQDKSVHKKQRHTAKRIFERIKAEGFEGGYTIVKEAVREIERKMGEVFVPLRHEPGEAQVDFGEALVKMAGMLRKIKFFVMSLAYSDAFFVMAFERECTESFWEGHVRGFEYFGGVPLKIVYDNSRIVVTKIVGTERELTRGFLELKSHYLFTEKLCRPRRGNEKGIVEGAVKYAHHPILIKGYVNQVDLFCDGKKVAEHARIWGKEAVTYNPVHYLAVLERKPGAFDQAMPLEEWELPECFFQLMGRLRKQKGESEGTREYIQVLRLLETSPFTRVRGAIEKALLCQGVSRDLVVQYLYQDPAVETFRLDQHPHLKGVEVKRPDLSLYQELMGGSR